MDQLIALKKSVDSSVAELLNFLTPNWRQAEQLIAINKKGSLLQVKTIIKFNI
jgi:hypothetical protein